MVWEFVVCCGWCDRLFVGGVCGVGECVGDDASVFRGREFGRDVRGVRRRGMVVRLGV